MRPRRSHRSAGCTRHARVGVALAAAALALVAGEAWCIYGAQCGALPGLWRGRRAGGAALAAAPRSSGPALRTREARGGAAASGGDLWFAKRRMDARRRSRPLADGATLLGPISPANPRDDAQIAALHRAAPLFLAADGALRSTAMDTRATLAPLTVVFDMDETLFATVAGLGHPAWDDVARFGALYNPHIGNRWGAGHDHEVLRPHAVEFLVECVRRGYRLMVFTASTKRWAVDQLEGLVARRAFERFVDEELAPSSAAATDVVRAALGVAINEWIATPASAWQRYAGQNVVAGHVGAARESAPAVHYVGDFATVELCEAAVDERAASLPHLFFHAYVYHAANMPLEGEPQRGTRSAAENVAFRTRQARGERGYSDAEEAARVRRESGPRHPFAATCYAVQGTGDFVDDHVAMGAADPAKRSALTWELRDASRAEVVSAKRAAPLRVRRFPRPMAGPMARSEAAEYWRIERGARAAAAGARIALLPKEGGGGAGVVDLAYREPPARPRTHRAAKWQLGRPAGDGRTPRGVRTRYRGGFFEKYLDGGSRVPSMKLISSATLADAFGRGPDDRGVTALDDDDALSRIAGDDRRTWEAAAAPAASRFVDAATPSAIAAYFPFSQAIKDLRLATCASRKSDATPQRDGALNAEAQREACAAWECACQGMSDLFGTAHSKSDFAAAAKRPAMREWWVANGCNTDPTPDAAAITARRVRIAAADFLFSNLQQTLLLL